MFEQYLPETRWFKNDLNRFVKIKNIRICCFLISFILGNCGEISENFIEHLRLLFILLYIHTSISIVSQTC